MIIQMIAYTILIIIGFIAGYSIYETLKQQ